MGNFILLFILFLLTGSVHLADPIGSLGEISPNFTPLQAMISRAGSASQSLAYTTFLWNKQLLSPYEYHLAICPDRCLEGRVVRLNSSLGCPNIDCFPCDCDIPKCEIYGTCCPDLLEMARLYRSEFRLVRDNGIDLNKINPSLFPDTLIFNAEQHDNTSSEDSSSYVRADDESPNEDLWSKFKSYPVCDKATVGPSFLQIKSCLSHYSNATERAGCENSYSPQNQSLLEYQHVTDTSTGISYYNDFCAECNQVPPAMREYWGVEIECNHFMHVYSALDRDTFLQLTRQPGSTCMVYQKPPGKAVSPKDKDATEDNSDNMVTECSPFWFDSVVSSCNVTGQWNQRDPDLEAACDRMDHQTLRVFDTRQSRGVYFRNIFCAICNSGDYPWFFDTCREQHGDGPVPVSTLPFTLLLGTRARSPMKKVYYSPFADCSASNWAGPDGLCYPLKCSSGKVLDVEEEVCKTALSGISGLGYSMRLYYHVKPKFKIASNSTFIEQAKCDLKICKSLYLNAFTAKIRATMSSLSATGEFTFNAILEDKSVAELNRVISKDRKAMANAGNDTYIHYPVMFSLDSKFIDQKEIDRDDFEKSAVDQLIHKDLEVGINDDHVLLLTPMTVLEDYDNLFMDCSLLSDDFEDCQCCSSRLIRLVFGADPADSIWSAVEQFLPLNPLLNCPYVSFNKTQYNIISDVTQVPPIISITIEFAKVQFNFTLPYDRNMLTLNANSLIVCHDALKSKVSKMEPSYYFAPKEKDKDILLSQYILIMIFLGASVVCLILTLVTYFFFSSLRSAAGMNNIFLCLTLVCAQILLIAATHINFSDTVACRILAVSTHFFWLCMFCWSFACCFHMYRIFTAKTRKAAGTARSLRFEIIKKAILCALFPVFTILAVVLYSMLANNELGYGKDGCFLDTGLLVWITVIAPLCGILLCNIFFFVTTVRKIHGVRKLQSGENIKKDERQNLYIYIKLSAMTGAFWIVAILAETLDNEPLRYIAIVLNGLQGVFIFMSYIANRRVLNMYLRAVGLEEYVLSSTTSSTDRSTLAKAASAVQKQQEEPIPKDNKVSNDKSLSTEPTRRISVISKDSGCRVGDEEGDSESGHKEHSNSQCE